MKTCCLVWEIPVIEGEHYNPIVNVIYMQKAKKFLNQLNRYFQDENMDWKCVLDRSACTQNEIFSSENQAVIFAPEAKTRQWLYKKEMQAVSIPKYYLDFAEYNEGKLDKIAIFFVNLKNDMQQISLLNFIVSSILQKLINGHKKIIQLQGYRFQNDALNFPH